MRLNMRLGVRMRLRLGVRMRLKVRVRVMVGLEVRTRLLGELQRPLHVSRRVLGVVGAVQPAGRGPRGRQGHLLVQQVVRGA